MLVPARPGLTNALGCIVADLRHDYVRTINAPLEEADIGALHAIFAEQAAAGDAALARKRSNFGTSQAFSVDMQFVGQTHVVRVPLENGPPGREALRALFERVYRGRFRVELAEIRARIVNANCSVIGRRAPIYLSVLIDTGGGKRSAPVKRREVIFDGWARHPGLPARTVPAGARDRRAGHRRAARHHDRDAPGDRVAVDEDGNDRFRGSGVMTLDPVTLAVIQNGLIQVCNEMDLAFSAPPSRPVISEANDRSDGIYAADDGALIAQGGRAAGLRRHHANSTGRDRDDRRGPGAAPSRATSTSSTTPISAART